MQYQITGDWTPADTSDHRLEVATTDDPQYIAIRQGGVNPGQPLFATRKQLGNLVTGTHSGSLKEFAQSR